jgi:hypothetical protein
MPAGVSTLTSPASGWDSSLAALSLLKVPPFRVVTDDVRRW